MEAERDALGCAAVNMHVDKGTLRMRFELAPDAAARLREQLTEKRAPRADVLTSVYYDTDSLSLYEDGLSLRVLKNGGSAQHLQLVEFPNGATHYASDRVEWEDVVHGDRP